MAISRGCRDISEGFKSAGDRRAGLLNDKHTERNKGEESSGTLIHSL